MQGGQLGRCRCFRALAKCVKNVRWSSVGREAVPRDGPKSRQGKWQVGVGSAVDAYHSSVFICMQASCRWGREAGGAAGGWLGRVGGGGDGGGAGQCCNEGRRVLIADRGDRKVFAIHCSLVVCGKGQEHRCTDTESEGG